MNSARLLIVTGGAASGIGEIPTSVRLLIEAADEILIVAPSLPTRIAWLASDTDKTREIADQRLQTVLRQISDAGTPAEGVVGADDPLLAFEDAVADFNPDHILVALRGPEDSGWQEQGLLEKVFERFGLPLTVFRVSD